MCTLGGYSRFQVTEMIEWGQKSKPKKVSVPKFNPPKNPMPNFRGIKFPESIKWYNCNESSDCFDYKKNSLLKSSCLKIYLPKFSYPKKFPKSKISNPRKSFGHPCHLKSGVPPPPPQGHLLSYEFLINFLFLADVWNTYWGIELMLVKEINKVTVQYTMLLLKDINWH